ncbi:MAG: DMT family transporter, partial [Bacteroidota bacterium]
HQKPALIEVHLAVLLFGLAGLFGKWLTLAPVIIVWGRASFAALSLLLWLKGDFGLRSKSSKALITFVLSGALLAVHWVAFFKSIQLSTVAIGLLTFSSFPLFTVFLGIILERKGISWREIVLSIGCTLGVGLVAPPISWESTMWQGACWGIFSGFTFAILAWVNKGLVQSSSGQQIAGWQNGVAALVLLPWVIQDLPSVVLSEWVLLVLLGVVFTAISHSLFIRSMVQLRPQTVSLIASLEPVYGILAAWLILQEVPSLQKIAGGTIILGITLWASLARKK